MVGHIVLFHNARGNPYWLLPGNGGTFLKATLPRPVPEAGSSMIVCSWIPEGAVLHACDCWFLQIIQIHLKSEQLPYYESVKIMDSKKPCHWCVTLFCGQYQETLSCLTFCHHCDISKLYCPANVPTMKAVIDHDSPSHSESYIDSSIKKTFFN